jgi:hypothetical protein
MKKVPHLLLIAALGAVLAAGSVGCSDETATGPQPIDSRTGLTGLWEGRLGTTSLRLEIDEAPDRSLVGGVTFGSGEDAKRYAIGGSVWSGPTTFTLLLDCTDDRVRTLRGTVVDDKVSGDYSETDEENRTHTVAWEANRLQTISPL